MMTAVARRTGTSYRCAQGCWWEKDGCYCPDGVTSSSLGDASSNVSLLVGMAMLGGMFWVIGAAGKAKRKRSLRGARSRRGRR